MVSRGIACISLRIIIIIIITIIIIIIIITIIMVAYILANWILCHPCRLNLFIESSMHTWYLLSSSLFSIIELLLRYTVLEALYELVYL